MEVTKIDENWLSPMNRIRWLRAFRARASRVTIRDGRRFDIRYCSKNIGVEKAPVKLAVVSPAKGEGFAPMGQFRLSKVIDRAWITESDREDNPPGLYLRCLDEFIQSSLNGVRVDDQWPDLFGKSMATLRRGFTTAKTQRGRKAKDVRVVTDGADGRVFLVKEQPNVQ